MSYLDRFRPFAHRNQPSSPLSFSDGQQQPFPAAPPLPSAGGHEMRDDHAFQNAVRPPPIQAPYLTPYLGLRARLSQVWINRWTILLLLVLVRTLLAIASLNDGLGSARREALSACTAVEQTGSAMASLPHYAALGVNKMTAEGITHAVHGLMQMLSLTVTGVEEIIIFVIGMLTNTYLCLFTLVATGSAHLALSVVQDFSSSVNKSLSGIEDDLGSAVSGFQDEINKFLGHLAGLPAISGNVPSIDLSKQVDALKAIQIPDSINEEIDKLNSSIPTFDQVQAGVDKLISTPFESLKQLINGSLNDYTFDHTLLPVPDKESLTFCSDNNGINDFFDGLVHTAHTARGVFLGVLLTAAILVCIPVAWLEIKRWRTLQVRAETLSREAVDSMDALYMASRPYTSQVGSWAAAKSSTTRHQVLIRWTVAYCTSLPALFLLALALAGLFSCLCQYILLRSIKSEVPDLANQVGAFSQKIVDSVNNASSHWAMGANGLMDTEGSNLNDDIFGWVNTSTTAVNDTLNGFVDQTTKLINDTFGDTVLAEPLQDLFDCLIGLKIKGIEKGLTWVHDHAYVDFPSMPNDTFTLQNLAKHTSSKADDNFLADPKDQTADEITETINRLVEKLMSAVRNEAIISTIILCLWFLVFFMGVGRAIYLFLKHDKMRADGGNEFPRGVPDSLFQAGQDEPKLAPAPSYDSAMPDVNPHAPYTLNPHTFPRSEPPSVEDDAALEKGRRPADLRNFTNMVVPPAHVNHKSMHGAIVSEKSGNPFIDRTYMI